MNENFQDKLTEALGGFYFLMIDKLEEGEKIDEQRNRQNIGFQLPKFGGCI